MSKLSLNQELFKAKLHIKNGNVEKAEKIFKQILKNFPNNKEAEISLLNLKNYKKPTQKNSVEQDLNKIVNFFKTGDYSNVIDKAKVFLKNNPEEYFVWNILGICLAETKRTNESINAFKKVIFLNSNFVEGYFNLGNALNTLGDFEQAIRVYNQILSFNPNSINAYFSIGDIYYNNGNFKKAIRLYNNVLSLKPDNVEALNNIGLALKNLCRLNEALNAFNKAIAIDNSYAEAHNNLGTVLQEKGDYKKALEFYNKAIKLYPEFAEAFYNKANVLKLQNKNLSAKVSFKKAISLKNNYPSAYNNLGIIYHKENKLAEAINSYQIALSLKQDYPEAYFNLGNAYLDLDKFEQAVEMYKQSLLFKPNYVGAYVNMVLALKKIKINKADPLLQLHILEILKRKDIVRPSTISDIAINLLKFDPQILKFLQFKKKPFLKLPLKKILITLSEKPLLLKLMISCPIPDLEFENLFTYLRSSMLSSISEIDESQKILPFQSALALQCFTNEYIYIENDKDKKNLQLLENEVKNSLLDGKQPKPQALLCLSCFKTLYENEWCDLLENNPKINEVYLRQVIEPQEEEILKSSILEFKKIKNDISKKVREQYEKRPYPRWVYIGSRQSQEGKTLEDLLNIRLHNNDINKLKNLKILIAGCGTGQHSIETALRFPKSKILAIDLSISSLSYAMRKTKELGINNIEYMQADILDINDFDNDFDIIESSGVLHHMENPQLGWQILTNQLKNGGLMKIGLYSHLARKNIMLIRKEITKSGISFEDNTIRTFRQKILNSNNKHYESLFGLSDFYSLSEVKDLLFHVQEQNFTIPLIIKSLNKLNLKFCGFVDKNITKNFIKINNNHNHQYDLSKWEKFEEDNPTTFAAMYQFWCQKTL